MARSWIGGGVVVNAVVDVDWPAWVWVYTGLLAARRKMMMTNSPPMSPESKPIRRH